MAATRRSASSRNARVAGESCALRRVTNANVSYSGGSSETLVSLREKPRVTSTLGAPRSCRRGGARRGRARP